MPIINRRFYANPAYGRALEIARIAEQLGQNVLLGGTNAAHKTGENVIEGVPSLDIKSLVGLALNRILTIPAAFANWSLGFG